MRDLIINSALTHSLLLVGPILGALLMRWVRCPGWSIVGGALAGILLGPTVFGRVAPDAFERHFVGGVEQRETRDGIVRRQQIEIAAALKAGSTEPARLEMRAAHMRELTDAERALAEAQWSFQRPFRSYAAATIALALLGAGMLRVPRGERSDGLMAPVSIGLWASVLPGTLATAAMIGFGDIETAPAVMTGAAVAIGPWVLPDLDRQAADHAERGGAHRMQTAGCIASIVAIGAATWGLWSQRGLDGALWSLSLLALPAGWILPVVGSIGGDGRGPAPATIVRGALQFVFVPALAACVAVRIELIEHFALWPLIGLVVLSGDGRWTGAFTGAMLPGGRRPLRTMRLVLGSMACGPTQLAVAALAVHWWSVPESVPLGLLAGAVLIETTAPLRRAVAHRLVEAEEELESIGRDE